jgi:dihydrolipoamide dehydrogenase
VNDNRVSLLLRDASGKGDSTETLVVETLLVATGRGPNTDGLGAGDVGLTMDRGFVVVDEWYRTNVDGISAIGDVITTGTRAHQQLAHLAAAEGVLAAERIAGKEIPLLNYDHVPTCTYCEPEIGSVGLSEKAATDRGYNVKVGTFPFSALGRAKIAGEAQGFVKIVAEAEYDQVLGVHIIGPRATELVAAATMALQLESTVEEIIRTIHAHPTMSEALGEAAHAAHGAAIHL